MFETRMAWLCGKKAARPRQYHHHAHRIAQSANVLFSKVVPKSQGEKLSVQLDSILYYPRNVEDFSQASLIQLQSTKASYGNQVIQVFEALLQPQALARKSQDHLIGLCILLFDELISVGCSTVKTNVVKVRPHAIDVPKDDAKVLHQFIQNLSESEQISARFSETRTQLLRVLIHNLVEVADRTHKPIKDLCKDRLLEQFCRLNRRDLHGPMIPPRQLQSLSLPCQSVFLESTQFQQR